MQKGRIKPYTDIGIKRVPCLRCGAPSSRQWQICALGNRYYGVCNPCDIKLNRVVLDFMNIPSKEVYCLIEEYKISKSPFLQKLIKKAG